MAKAKSSKSGGSIQPARIPRGANDKINHAIIGLGSMGQGHVKYVLDDPQAQLVGVCDVMQSRVAETLEKVGKDCRGYRDFRDMLNNESIDIVHVVTPPHWHALQNIYALNAGCDVWAEKPMTRTISEGAQIAAAVKRNSRVFRLNTWFRMHSPFYGLGT
ncbi:MAG: Gfo/Idh/MocA family oxidoreductase, partial [Lentisphaerae bacterium]|nr:Gfo/Idh/MocA family oxidoreductase [Lentisphaerota bacterium]